MRGLLPPALLLALTATAGIALLALRGSRGAVMEQPTAPEPPHDDPGVPLPADAGIRPYQTTATLLEDLRDALPGPDDALAHECWRVSSALGKQARWTLLNLAPREASPRVRALLVFTAGVHTPDDELLLASLRDREPQVRAAAALAAGYVAGGSSTELLIGRVPVPLGRDMPQETRTRLEREATREEDQGARGTMQAVLDSTLPARR